MATYPIRQLADNGGTAQFVPVTAPEAVQFPDGSNLNTLIGSIATIESNPVAANHAVGEFLCINGQVYEVIDAITAGDSISLGENVQVTNLGSQITALNNGLIKVVNIPFSSFEWSTAQNRYVLSNYHPTFDTVIGYLVYGTNGMVVFGAYYYAQSDTLSVDGWIPSTTSKITSSFQFVCYELGY